MAPSNGEHSATINALILTAVVHRRVPVISSGAKAWTKTAEMTNVTTRVVNGELA